MLKYLREGGVTNTLTSRGYGETDPIASNDTDEGRQQNRRVVLRTLN
jgi:OOP family OmpA-OmpF porin